MELRIDHPCDAPPAHRRHRHLYSIVVVVVVFICVGEDFLEKKHLPYTNVVVVVVLSAYQGREI